MEADSRADGAHGPREGAGGQRRAVHRRRRGGVQGQEPTGRRFEDVDEVYFFTFEDGRVAEAWGIEDSLDRMRQLGLEALS